MLLDHPPSKTSTTSPRSAEGVKPVCFHCGLDCPDEGIRSGERVFCCTGCRTVHDLLAGAGLIRFYALERHPGSRPRPDQPAGHFAYLRDPDVRAALLDYEDDRLARVTFHLPAIHCAACVWLLENLHRLHPGLGRAEVNFSHRMATVDFDPRQIDLAEVAEILARLGYPPRLQLDEIHRPERPRVNRDLWMRLGVAGFAAGNIMLLSFAVYLGLAEESPELNRFVAWASVALSLPVLLFSAAGYFRSAWNSLRHRAPGIDLPIAVGLAALFGQSLWEIAAGRGEGYLDSFSALVFLLLAGRVFADRTQARLVFERDYTAYFPLSVTRVDAAGTEMVVPITRLAVGDEVVVRDGELIPADADLLAGEAWIDYSFVTGESVPVLRRPGDRLFAGGRQVGAPLRLRTRKAVSRGYLTSLWDRQAFRRPEAESLSASVDRIGRWFAPVILLIALTLGGVWWFQTDAATAVRVFASTLIIACPCALAMAAPYTFGAASRVLARHGLFLRNAAVVEQLARVNAVALDKTGTLTAPGAGGLDYHGRPLEADERTAVAAVAAASTHPLSRRLAQAWSSGSRPEVREFRETAGRGVSGRVGGRLIRIGRAEFVDASAEPSVGTPSAVWISLDGAVAGQVHFPSARRAGLDDLLNGLRRDGHPLALLSGDPAAAEAEWRPLFGPEAPLRFGAGPHEKLDFIRAWQAEGRVVLMAGDGLNDAGALRQAEVGVAVSDDVTAFAPACDAILDAQALPRLPALLRLARSAMFVLRACFVVSFAYNLGGLVLAARGVVTPLLSAILMPTASFSAILLAVLGVRLAARRLGLPPPPSTASAA
jgi:Cu+-exporting ATPase